MGRKKFDQPKIRLTRLYTKTGDEGFTLLAGGQRVRKNEARIEAYGTVDELNAFLGLAIRSVTEMGGALAAPGAMGDQLLRVQHELFNLGSLLATRAEDLRPNQASIRGEDVERLERWIDAANEQLAPLASFVLPGGNRLAAELHVCRTVCRRAERRVVTLAEAGEAPAEALRYLNRLSDAFFVWSRLANFAAGEPERLWDPNFETRIAGDEE